jgi:integrase
MNNAERIQVGDRVTIYQRGKKKTWCADFWRDGEHCRQSLKTANKKVAMERATKLAATLVDGTYHRPAPAAAIAATVESYIEFLKTEGRAIKTIVKYRGIFDNLISFLIAQNVTRMGQFTALHFDRFRSHRRQDHQPKTLYTEGVVIKQFFRWARRRKIILENPVEDIKLSKPKRVPKGGPTREQIDTILVETKGRLRAMIAVLAFTGMRSGELQRLRREDVDLGENWIHIVSRPGAETKTRESRKVPIHPRLRAILAGFPRSRGAWFFTAEVSAKYPDGGHWISPKKLNDRFAVILTKLKLPVGRENGFVIHSLRHSFETISVNAGIPQRVVDAWLGHTSDRSMAAVYYRLSDDESQRFMYSVPFGTGAPAACAGKEIAS